MGCRWKVVAVAVALTACAEQPYEPPTRTDQVKAEEVRVGALIEQHERPGFGGNRGECAVRILGIDGSSTFAWALCSFPPHSGVSTAYRIDGNQVRAPEDGSRFADSIKQMFPEALANAVLEDPDRLRPGEP